jgi:hypothetical protein
MLLLSKAEDEQQLLLISEARAEKELLLVSAAGLLSKKCC